LSSEVCKFIISYLLFFVKIKFSPVVIDPKCDIKTTGRRLLWGKLVNAGQTCVAPDYVLVPREFQDELIRALEKSLVLSPFQSFLEVSYKD
jgi:hypothetical protein